MRDFSKKTLRALAHKGVTILHPVAIPATSGELPFANADRGYAVNDNGTHRVLRFREVLHLAA